MAKQTCILCGWVAMMTLVAAGCNQVLGIDNDYYLSGTAGDGGSHASTTSMMGTGASGMCGDRQVTSDEACDDGNTSNSDACSSDCEEQEVLGVSASNFHTCALLSGGKVKCWGGNLFGELGLGDELPRGNDPGTIPAYLDPVDLGQDANGAALEALAIAAGRRHTCALLVDGRVKCWGRNGGGQLGLGDTGSRGIVPGQMGDALKAVDLGPDVKATAVATGDDHTCALLEGGAVKCWGTNAFGQLGLGHNNNRGDKDGDMGANLLAVDLGRGAKAIAITAGREYSCAILSNNSVKCWGRNQYGQLGLDNSANIGGSPGEMGDALSPVNLKTDGVDLGAKTIAAGSAHTCAVLLDGHAKCWGRNVYGELGVGNAIDSGGNAGDMADLPFVKLSWSTGATTIAIQPSSYHHTCALSSDGSVKCWGVNTYGQIGLPVTNPPTPLGDKTGQMEGLPALDIHPNLTATAISAGFEYSCAVLGARLKCWGRSSRPDALGTLGLGDTNSHGDQPGSMGVALPFVALFNPSW